jgi:phosphate transport system substrate-binding protein
MIKPVLRTLAAALLLSALSAGAGPFVHAETLRIGGTGAALGTMRILGDAFMRGRQAATIEVLPSLGSGGGIKALAANAIDLAVSSRDLKDEERAQGLRSQVYGRTALVFATPTSNPVDGVTSAELVALFGGEENVWPNGAPARPILRPKTETDTKLADDHIPGLRDAIESARTRSGVPMYFTDQEAADALERIPGSVGTTSLSVIISEKRHLKALALDGRVASPRSIADGSYPIIKSLYFVLSAEPSQLAKDFLDFTFSSEGRSILESTGHQALPGVTG